MGGLVMSRYDRMMRRIRSGDCILIDGATGTETQRRGVPQLVQLARRAVDGREGEGARRTLHGRIISRQLLCWHGVNGLSTWEKQCN